MGFFLLAVTLLLELAGAGWSYYYSTHTLAGLASILNEALSTMHWASRYHLHVTVAMIGWAWVGMYVVVHLAAIFAYARDIAKERLKMGAPDRYVAMVDQIYRELQRAAPAPGLERVARLDWPHSFSYAPGYTQKLSFLGLRLVIDEGLLKHRCLKPLLAQQLFAWNSGDVWLRVFLGCLLPLPFIAVLGVIIGLPIGIGPVLMFLFWKKYWRDRVYAGDYFAARLGQMDELIEALDQVVRPRERRQNLLLREYPYASERIGRLMRLPAYTKFSRASAKTASPGGNPSTEWSFPRSESASSARTDERKTNANQQTPSKTQENEGPAASSTSQPSMPQADTPSSASRGRSAEWLRQQAKAPMSSAASDRSSSSGQVNRDRSERPDQKQTHRYPSGSAHSSQERPPQTPMAEEKKPPRRKGPPWNPAFTSSLTLTLRFADAGWHLRWSTPNTDVFFSALEEFKSRLGDEYYWDPFAFDEKGGWWVAYGALSKVSDLFNNYREARDTLEQEYQKQYEEQLRRNRERAAREQQEQQAKQQQKTGGPGTSSKASANERSQAKQPPTHEEIRLPRSSQEAFALLGVSPPVTFAEVKRAYRAKALKCHPDHGGSHAQMVVINAAFELAQKAVS